MGSPSLRPIKHMMILLQDYTQMRVIIKSVLDLAVRKGITQYNPAEMIKLPKASSDANTPKRAYSKQEAQIDIMREAVSLGV